MTRPWWAGLPAAEARLDCGGQPHRLRWAAGQLTRLDHTDDLAGEQILSALGGQRFPAWTCWNRGPSTRPTCGC